MGRGRQQPPPPRHRVPAGGAARLGILKHGGSVSGTATAASIWNTGAIGAAVAWQRYEIAIAFAVVNSLLVRVRQSAKELLPEDADDPDA